MYLCTPNVRGNANGFACCRCLFFHGNQVTSPTSTRPYIEICLTTRITQVVKDILLRILDCVGTWRLCALAASSKAHNQWWTSVGEYTSGHLERKQAFKLLNFLWDQPSCSCLYHCLLLCPLSLLPSLSQGCLSRQTDLNMEAQQMFVELRSCGKIMTEPIFSVKYEYTSY